MRWDPIQTLECDVCDVTAEFTMTPLVGGGWDSRGLKRNSERDGWVWVGGDVHHCESCAVCENCRLSDWDCECD